MNIEQHADRCGKGRQSERGRSLTGGEPNRIPCAALDAKLAFCNIVQTGSMEPRRSARNQRRVLKDATARKLSRTK